MERVLAIAGNVTGLADSAAHHRQNDMVKTELKFDLKTKEW